MEIIYAVFARSVIRKGFGKLKGVLINLGNPGGKIRKFLIDGFRLFFYHHDTLLS
jgi:hypothetical protein